jgi:MauM/NapG family ferredoxin protein
MKRRRISTLRLVRIAAQCFFFMLFVAMVWSLTLPAIMPLNPKYFFWCDPLAMGLTMLAERIWLSGAILAFLVLLGAFWLGRAFCGWFCPLGACFDALGALRERWQKPREAEPSPWQALKYAVYAALIVLALFGVQGAWLFDPLSIMMRTLSYVLHPWVNAALERSVVSLLTFFSEPVWLEEGYQYLRESVLGIAPARFSHSWLIALFFGLIAGAVFWQRRFWCRYLCPLGAMLGGVAKSGTLRRVVSDCSGQCGECRHVCPTNAIDSTTRTKMEECILCLRCLDSCPGQKARFSHAAWVAPWSGKGASQKGVNQARLAGTSPVSGQRGLSRLAFFYLALISGLALLGCGSRKRLGAPPKQALRPPGALPEEHFIDRCIRCGNCMKACPTHVLQPALAESGWAGLWTPRMNFPAGYCEYQCHRCIQVCPTEALRPLSLPQKKAHKIGLASIDPKRCYVWADQKNCLVCEEHCPVPDKAIRVQTRQLADGTILRLPVVDPERCIGCGICVSKCPTRPWRAIWVERIPS